MTAKARAPLTPAFATYLGLAQIEGANPPLVERRHILRWASQSREGKEHFSSCDKRGGDLRCTCEGWAHRRSCKHELGHLPTLAHFGVTFGPPPADPGGAALDAAQGALDGETADWRDELPPNFGTVAVTPEVLERAFGPTGTPPLAAVGVSAWGNLPATLDEAVADDGDRWIQSRTAAGVRLVCASCGAVRGWPTEVGAIDWLATDGVCGCGGAGPTPPAPGAERKPIADCLGDLYGQ
jgi:hypothetical protein